VLAAGAAAPECDGHVVDLDAALGKEFLDVSLGEVEAPIA
jgi:hypothetical protein